MKRTHIAQTWRSHWRTTLMACALGLSTLGLQAAAVAAETNPIKIGIIGAGKIGGTLAKLWVDAGHEVLISSRHPDELKPLAQSLGPKAHVGTPRDAVLFSNVVLISIPYGALPQVGKDLVTELAGKIVIDTGNPYPERDGDMALEARRKGEPVAIPIAGDDSHALAVTSQLIKDAGFEPVTVGPLSSAKLFDVGTPVYVQLLTAKELRARLKL
jgi:predicted dinucleotide-binding enzyme